MNETPTWAKVLGWCIVVPLLILGGVVFGLALLWVALWIWTKLP